MKDMTLSALRDYCKAHSCKTCGREYKEFCARRNDQPCFWYIKDELNEQDAEDKTFNGAINGKRQA